MQQIDTLIKIGGSITELSDRTILQNLCEELELLYQEFPCFVILPGGGIFAENIRTIQKQSGFNDETAHWMAIYGMEQNRLYLNDFFQNVKSITPIKLKEAKNKLDDDCPHLLSIQQFMTEVSALEHTWNTTSDAIAAEIAFYLGLKRILFVKDIDGIISKGKRLNECTVDELLLLPSSPLDPLTPELLLKFKPEVYIVNGFHPHRIEKIFKQKDTIITKIIYD